MGDVIEQKRFLGSKTLRLQQCVDFGFRVPPFVAVPSSLSKTLFSSSSLREKVTAEVKHVLQAERYAIRSSALIEDQTRESHAGQFKTFINVSAEDICQRIYDVLKHANTYLEGNLDQFSLLIQEYISPDISGVTFTRNPNGNREMIVEYGYDEGEKIVSGAVRPERALFYWTQVKGMNLPKTLLRAQAVEQWKKLEEKFYSPQDCEWCIQGNTFFLLQTRPITSISKHQYVQIQFLEEALPKKGRYFFQKTEISEIAPRPSLVTLDLLQRIYAQSGPVANVYKKYGVRYEDTKFLKVFGNELFVNKEKELQSILPSYSCLSTEVFTPRFHDFSKFGFTIANLFSLNTIRTNQYERFFQELKAKIEGAGDGQGNVQSVVEKFLSDYELIFEINLVSGFAIKKCESAMKRQGVGFSEILKASSCFVDWRKYDVRAPLHLNGNSLDIADELAFIEPAKEKKNANEPFPPWWGKMPEHKKNIYHKRIVEAILFHRLRELARWLTVKNINELRAALLKEAKQNRFSHARDIYFSKLGDILQGKIRESDCRQNKERYEQWNSFHLPNSITSSPVVHTTATLGVSSGVASGRLLDTQSIGDHHSKSEKVILYAEMLSPDLTRYFESVAGIVSNNGGVLSHLAIVAREKNIPVVVGFSIAESAITIGEMVQINGESGEIQKIRARV